MAGSSFSPLIQAFSGSPQQPQIVFLNECEGRHLRLRAFKRYQDLVQIRKKIFFENAVFARAVFAQEMEFLYEKLPGLAIFTAKTKFQDKLRVPFKMRQ